ncbi:hypothetical protein BIFGAL_03836 [Bifidobacterium gallicum DSM 20093 = LMG 11596]|uniref:Uncharacterized protein n=1 Tax=Bifidobacterium gallicum DSM 20093 = LMG 11596 TaxID=561180 RepID=D1NVF2_9BIFI|nr:hypothetical protein BIFGAL_03836 [Bifidobacterium gallicum DSM 20093 = LMG 11596]
MTTSGKSVRSGCVSKMTGDVAVAGMVRVGKSGVDRDARDAGAGEVGAVAGAEAEAGAGAEASPVEEVVSVGVVCCMPSTVANKMCAGFRS